MTTVYVPLQVLRTFTVNNKTVSLPDTVLGFFPVYKSYEQAESAFPDSVIFEFDVEEPNQ